MGIFFACLNAVLSDVRVCIPEDPQRARGRGNMSDILLRRILTGADLMTHDLKIHATEEGGRQAGGEGQDGTEGWREGLREERG